MNFPQEIGCPSCGERLSLDEGERKSTSVTCPSCGEIITPDRCQGASSAAAEEGDETWSRLWRRGWSSESIRTRILFTLAAIAVYRAGRHFFIPVFSGRVIDELYRNRVPLSEYSVFWQGIFPYIIGSVIILFLSGFIPPLKELRDGSARQRRLFDRCVYFAVLLYSIVTAVGQYQALTEKMISGEMFINNDSLTFLSFMAVTVAGSMFLVWLADMVTKKGMGNGISVILLADFLAHSPDTLRRIKVAVLNEVRPGSALILTVVLPLAFLIFCVVMVTARRSLRLEPSGEETGGTDGGGVIEMPVRFFPAGIIPFVFAGPLLTIPGLVFSFNFLSVWYLILYCGLVVALAIPFTANIYDPEDISRRLRLAGYRIAGTGSEKEEMGAIDRALSAGILPGLLSALAVAVLPYVVYSTWKVSSLFLSKELLLFVAVSVSLAADFRGKVRREISGTVVLCTTETVLDAELICGILKRTGIPAQVCDTRVISAVGSFAPWEICRPKYLPAMIHPRLAGGAVEVTVAPAVCDDARSILARKGLLEVPARQ